MAAKVIVVEDERIVGLNLKQHLLKLGYLVPGMAVNSAQALHAIEQHKPDIVLMDIHIEGEVDGIETALLSNSKYKVPIIYLTAYSEESTLIRARATHPYGFLLKPFSERELHATIQMALERHKIELALEHSRARLRMALTAANMTDWELKRLDNNGEMLYAGQADFLVGHTERSFCGKREEFIRLVAPEDREKVNQLLEQCIAGDLLCDVEFRTAEPASPARWLRLQGKMLNEAGAELHLIGVLQNVTERKLTEQRLNQAATVFDAIQDGIIILDRNAHVIGCNSSYTSITGYTLADLEGRTPSCFEPKLMRPNIFRDLENVRKNGGNWRTELTIDKKDQGSFPALVSLTSVRDGSDALSHFVMVVTDLSPVRSVEKKLQYLAHHDPLTDLPNRLLTMERLSQALLRGARHQERVAVLFIDLDRFKWVNDSLGHDAGDALLKEVAVRMRECLRQDDTLGRLGGDEFLIVVDPAESEQDVAIVARKLIETVARPIAIFNHMVEVSCSVGISMFPEDGTRASALIRAADTAMYAAKDRGRNCYEFFTQSMMDKAMRFLALNHDLHRGLNKGELLLYYQPQLSIITGKIIGLEALVRWQHPQRGLIGPTDIIPVAEDSGLIVELGEWIMREACHQLRIWQNANLPPIQVAVNVSAIQILKSRFVAMVQGILADCRVDPEYLEIEITESVLQSGEACIAALEKLRQLGVKISIDDFGTGYSCLSSLKLLPIDKLKIDRAFIQDIPDDENDVAITEVIIAVARKLKMDVIAEGVETLTQVEFLRERGCNQFQGFLYSRPVHADEVPALLQKQDWNIMQADTFTVGI
jgi:diguanylate cyclase (GGDEF)-like protein/PAS domain S-box-containing protein